MRKGWKSDNRDYSTRESPTIDLGTIIAYAVSIAFIGLIVYITLL